MTTDIKSRLSFVGKQLKEKLNQKQAAEEAAEASPAEDAARELSEPSPAEAAGKEAAEEMREAQAPGTKASEPPAPEPVQPPSSPKTREEEVRVTDEELAAVLLAFGWHVPDDEQIGAFIPPADSTATAPAPEELAAEVSAVMEVFTQEGVNVYLEDVTEQTPRGESAQAQDLPQTTAVFPAIGAEGKGAPEEASPEEAPEPAGEEETLPEQLDARTLFRSMNQDILKEVFSEEELSELEGDATHVFQKEEMAEMEDLSDRQKQAEEQKPPEAETPPQPETPPAPEKPERRRRKRAGAEKAEKKREEPRPESRTPEEPEFTARDYRPIRRKRSYRTGLRGGLMYFGFVICVSAILASVAWLAADDVLSLNKDYVEAEVYVGEELDMKQVSDELYNKGLIKYRKLFRIFAKLMKADTKMDPGVYTLSTKLDYNAMVHAMHQSTGGPVERATVMVMIPEGKTLKQTFQILSDHGVCPYETLLECAANHDFKYDFLEDIPYGAENRLEGYLFPDTYQFYAPSEPEEAIERFLSNFNTKVTAEMRLQAQEMGYSLREMLTIASLIEMEAGKDTERATIASVIYNRLNSSYYPYLQIDAAIQYALEERKESLTNADLEIDSPYNTYKYAGLPPGPIANPGLASIRAALNPETTGYYFYALNKTGSHNFFATLDQFNSFVNSSEFGG